MADDNTISGYGIRFNSEAVIGGAFREMIAPGAFDRSLRERPDVFMLLGHDPARVLGRVSAGTLDLRPDRIGIFFTLKPDPTTPSGQEAIGTVARQDVKQTSFGFIVRDEEWKDGGARLPLRIVHDADLIEISLVVEPAYKDTSAAMRLSKSFASQARRDEKRHNFYAYQRRRYETAKAAMRARGINV